VLDTLANALLASYDDYATLFLLIAAVPSVIGELAFAIWLLLRGGRQPAARPTALDDHHPPARGRLDAWALALEGGAGLLGRLCRATVRRDPGPFATAARWVGSGGWGSCRPTAPSGATQQRRAASCTE
jgi:hypothetical protein